jgi:protoporphyrinogen oxidase
VSTHDVVVLGAGPAGLGAAYRLARAGHDVCVLEREPHVGGLASSFEVAGLRVDHGSHRLHPTTPPAVMQTVRELLGDDLQRRPRHGRIRMAGRFVRFPPQPFDLLRRLPPTLSMRLARDMATSPWRHPHVDTFDAAVRGSLGPTMAERFYAPYVRKLFGVDATELSGELARRRIGASSAKALVRRVMRPEPDRGVFYYPRRAYGEIAERLADAAVAAGARIELGTAVTALRSTNDAIAVDTEGGTAFTGSSAWSTLALALLARLAGAPESVVAAAARLESRALALVYLVVPTSQWTEFDAHYFPELDVPMARVSEPKNYRDSADDPSAITVLCAELPCSVDDEIWRASDADLGALVVESLRRSALAVPTPIHVESRRVPRAYPVYRVGYEAALATVDGWASGVPRLLHFGRQGLFAHDNTHHALAMAWAAADAFSVDATSGGVVDAHAWAHARRGFDRHVVED